MSFKLFLSYKLVHGNSATNCESRRHKDQVATKETQSAHLVEHPRYQVGVKMPHFSQSDWTAHDWNTECIWNTDWPEIAF